MFLIRAAVLASPAPEQVAMSQAPTSVAVDPATAGDASIVAVKAATTTAATTDRDAIAPMLFAMPPSLEPC